MILEVESLGIFRNKDRMENIELTDEFLSCMLLICQQYVHPNYLYDKQFLTDRLSEGGTSLMEQCVF